VSSIIVKAKKYEQCVMTNGQCNEQGNKEKWKWRPNLDTHTTEYRLPKCAHPTEVQKCLIKSKIFIKPSW